MKAQDSYSEDNLPEFTPMPWYALDLDPMRFLLTDRLPAGQSEKFGMLFLNVISFGTPSGACFSLLAIFFSLR